MARIDVRSQKSLLDLRYGLVDHTTKTPISREEIGLHLIPPYPGDPKFSISSWPGADLAKALISIPRCHLTMTGMIWPSIGCLGCIPAVKVETRISPCGIGSCVRLSWKD